jgi:hypothetical protein
MKYTVKVLIMLSLCYQPVLLLAELPRRTPGLSLMVGGSKSQKQLERSQAGLSRLRAFDESVPHQRFHAIVCCCCQPDADPR